MTTSAQSASFKKWRVRREVHLSPDFTGEESAGQPENGTEEMNAVLLLGMHRSGTSCLAKCLRSMGLNFNMDRIGPVPEKHLEYNWVNDFNDRLLGGDWRTPRAPRRWLQNVLLSRALQTRIRRAHSAPSLVGIKDPRFLVTLDFWQQHLDTMILLGIFRRPMEVVASLLAREDEYGHASKEQGLALWCTSNRRLLDLTRQHHSPLLNFNTSTLAFRHDLEKACETLSLPFSVAGFDSVYRPSRKHHDISDIPRDARPIYSELLDMWNEWK